jgi:hypothetical protein
LHLGVFEQPEKKVFFSDLLDEGAPVRKTKMNSKRRSNHGRDYEDRWERDPRFKREPHGGSGCPAE